MPRPCSLRRLSSPARTLLRDFLLLLVVGSAGFLSILAVQYPSETGREHVSQQSPPWAAVAASPLAMDGFSLVIHIDGKENLRLHADRMRLQRKKWGFFRIGLLKEMVIENAAVILHQGTAAGNEGSREEGRSGQPLEEGRPAAVSAYDGLAELVDTLPIGRLSGLSFRPVQVEIDDDLGRHSRIGAQSATIDPGKGTLSLAGRVQVRSGGRILSAPALDLDARKGEIAGPAGCLLQDGAGRRTLQPCRLDVYLSGSD